MANAETIKAMLAEYDFRTLPLTDDQMICAVCNEPPQHDSRGFRMPSLLYFAAIGDESSLTVCSTRCFRRVITAALVKG